MPPQKLLDYTGNEYILNDLKRLKKHKSLKKDIENTHAIIRGKILEANAALFPFPFGDLLGDTTHQGKVIRFYKKRIKITGSGTGTSNGARLIFGVKGRAEQFIPLLVFLASEEKSFYKINNKQLPLTKSGIIKIINEKLL